MNKILYYLFVILLLFSHIDTYGKHSVICDVTYEESIGEWSDYRRVKVDFMTGKEMGSYIDQTKLFAKIWYSTNEFFIVKMVFDQPIMYEIDDFLAFMIIGTDMLNEGLAGTQVNGKEKDRKWRIYGKDETSFFIDPQFDKGEYKTYNDRIREDIKNGYKIYKRERPKEETKYKGLTKGTVEYVSSKDWYIVKTEYNYIGVIRDKWSAFYGRIDVNDIVFADFKNKGKTSISNATKDSFGPNIIVEEFFRNYNDCLNWIKERFDQ